MTKRNLVILLHSVALICCAVSLILSCIQGNTRSIFINISVTVICLVNVFVSHNIYNQRNNK